MKIQENVTLAKYTTFKIGGPARFFCKVENEKDLLEAVRFAKEQNQKIFILGEGSNVLISDAGFFGLVIRMAIKGVEVAPTDNEKYILTSGAGELWDKLVEKAVSAGLHGIENLSAIPGTVGAAPVQNIGAYGMDVSESILSVRVLDTDTLEFVEFSNEECRFTYRDSMFKQDRERYIITSVKFGLVMEGKVNIEYKDLKLYFDSVNNNNPTLEEVRKAVIEIRWKKLPDWKLWGNAGSFFKNPLISTMHYGELQKKYPEIPGYTESNGLVKVPLAWILDNVCNMKGICEGNVCSYDAQPLVIVAKPGAKSEEIVKFSQKLMNAVREKTGIEVEGEVQWVN